MARHFADTGGDRGRVLSEPATPGASPKRGGEPPTGNPSLRQSAVAFSVVVIKRCYLVTVFVEAMAYNRGDLPPLAGWTRQTGIGSGGGGGGASWMSFSADDLPSAGARASPRAVGPPSHLHQGHTVLVPTFGTHASPFTSSDTAAVRPILKPQAVGFPNHTTIRRCEANLEDAQVTRTVPLLPIGAASHECKK